MDGKLNMKEQSVEVLPLRQSRYLFFSNLCASAEGLEDVVIGPKQFIFAMTRNQHIAFSQAYTSIPKYLGNQLYLPGVTEKKWFFNSFKVR